MRMVVWRDTRSGSRLFWVWGAYGLAMMGLWQAVRAAGLPDVVSWAFAGALAWCLLAWTLGW
jgi:hypothetical protein